VLGNVILAASPTHSSSSSSTFLLILVVLVGLFYFVMIRPQSWRRRLVMEQQRQVQPGQRVRTTAGMYATVVSVEDDDVILEPAPGIQERYIKRAIMEVLPDDSAAGTGFASEPFTGTEDEASPDGDASDSTVDAAAAEDESTEDAADEAPNDEDVTEENRTPDSV
jgi:preprotein translocase subunit YajC